MTLCAKDLMHRENLVTIGPGATVGDLNGLLARHRISGVPVVDAERNCVGVVSQSDIVRLISRDLARPVGFYLALPSYLTEHGELERHLREKKVAEIMEPRVHSVSSGDSVATVARIMRRLHIHRVLVVDDGKLVGIVSALDLLMVFEKPAFFREFYGDRAATASHERANHAGSRS